MKKNFLKVVVLAVMFVFLAITAADAAITLTWDPPTTNVDGTPLTDLEGYRVYYGTASGNYDTNIDATNVVSYEVEGLIPGNTYYFAVTAYDTSGNESDYSNEVSGIADGLGVINLRIVANEATGPGYSWCWDWNTESNLAGYHVIWARTRAELETKV
ncbi:MAG: hypothetical protein GWO79_00385, partial [Actinobacteria bacterium]|nr:hypothetical protein [Actinomycetota bacterium]